jgi:hypothetical protein
LEMYMMSITETKKYLLLLFGCSLNTKNTA